MHAVQDAIVWNDSGANPPAAKKGKKVYINVYF